MDNSELKRLVKTIAKRNGMTHKEAFTIARLSIGMIYAIEINKITKSKKMLEKIKFSDLELED